MVSVELNHEIIICVAVVIVEVSEISFLAAGAARPVRLVIVYAVLSGGDFDTMEPAPLNCLL
jgi:hypothetical protein